MPFCWDFHLSEQSCIQMKRSERNSVVFQALEAPQLCSAGNTAAVAVKDEAARSTGVREKVRNEKSGRESKRWGTWRPRQIRKWMRSFCICVVPVSALDDQRSEHQGRLESHEAANPPLAAVNTPSSGMYWNVVPAALLPLLPSLQIAHTPHHTLETYRKYPKLTGEKLQPSRASWRQRDRI